jgi:hypothetical protein
MNIEIWVLIFFFKAGYGGGAASAEFLSERRCRDAVIAIKEASGSWGGADWAVCVKK